MSTLWPQGNELKAPEGAGLREQLAALIVDTQDDPLPASLAIVGQPGDWCVAAVYRDRHTWLAATRTPSTARHFKNLDAAFNAAQEIHTLTALDLTNPDAARWLKISLRHRAYA